MLVDSGQVALAVASYVAATKTLAQDFNSPNFSPSYGVLAASNEDHKHMLTRRGKSAAQLYNVSVAETAALQPAKTDNQATGDMVYFIRTGGAAAAMLCQMHLAHLSDRADLLAYLKDEYGYVNDLTNTAFAIFNASVTASRVLGGVNTFVNNSLDRYDDYRFFKASDEAILDVALRAQATLVNSYTTAPKGGASDLRPMTLAEALRAMANIEHQCTHAGLKALIDKSVQNTTINVDVGGIVTVTPPAKGN